MGHRLGRSEDDVRERGLAGRVQLIRSEIYGEHGVPDLANRLGLPARTWANYESGVVIPAEVMLRFLDITGTEPRWLLSGEGARYRAASPGACAELARPHGAPAAPGSAAPDATTLVVLPASDFAPRRRPTD